MFRWKTSSVSHDHFHLVLHYFASQGHTRHHQQNSSATFYTDSGKKSWWQYSWEYSGTGGNVWDNWDLSSENLFPKRIREGKQEKYTVYRTTHKLSWTTNNQPNTSNRPSVKERKQCWHRRPSWNQKNLGT